MKSAALYLTKTLLKILIIDALFAVIYAIIIVTVSPHTGHHGDWEVMFLYDWKVITFLFFFYFVSKMVFSLSVYFNLIVKVRNNFFLRILFFLLFPLLGIFLYIGEEKRVILEEGIIHLFYIFSMVWFYWRFSLFLKRRELVNEITMSE